MAETPNTGVLMALEKQSAREFSTDLSTVHVFSGINCGLDVLKMTSDKIQTRLSAHSEERRNARLSKDSQIYRINYMLLYHFRVKACSCHKYVTFFPTFLSGSGTVRACMHPQLCMF